MVQRVVADIASIERHAEIPRLLRLCAARTATELNVSSVASALAIPARTVDAYLAHLANVFLIRLVPAWSTNLSAKVVRRPTLLMLDTGLACHLAGAVLDGGRSEQAAPVGRLVETFVGVELRKQLSWSVERPSLWHDRDRGGREVDYLLEHPDGRIVGVEVKASSTVVASDFGGLRFLQERLGDRFHHGVVSTSARTPCPSDNGCTPCPSRRSGRRLAQARRNDRGGARGLDRGENDAADESARGRARPPSSSISRKITQLKEKSLPALA